MNEQKNKSVILKHSMTVETTSPTDHLLEMLASDDFEGLPFSSNVNEWRVFEVLQKVEAENAITDAIVSLIKQWMLFNKWINQHEGEPYTTEVGQVYSRIHAILANFDRPRPTGEIMNFFMPKRMNTTEG